MGFLDRPRFFKSKPLAAQPFSVIFDSQKEIHTAGSLVEGTLVVDVEGCCRAGIERIEVSFRGVEKSTWLMPMVGTRVADARAQETILLEESHTVYPSPDDPLLGTLPFSIAIPSSTTQRSTGKILPPSFAGGDRPTSQTSAGSSKKGSMNGSSIASIRYILSVSSVLSKKKKGVTYQYPIPYLPPRTQRSLPPSSLLPLPPDEYEGLSLPAEPPSVPSEGWASHSMLSQLASTGGINLKALAALASKESPRVEIKLSLPSLSPLPSILPIPIHLSLSFLSAPLPISTTAHPPPSLPSPSAISLRLVRFVTSKAMGSTETSLQDVFLLPYNAGSRVWYSPSSWVLPSDDTSPSSATAGDSPGTKRSRVTMSLVGEIVIKASPTFERTQEHNVGLSYQIEVLCPGLPRDGCVTVVKGLELSSWIRDPEEEDEEETMTRRRGVGVARAAEAEADEQQQGEALPRYVRDGEGWTA